MSREKQIEEMAKALYDIVIARRGSTKSSFISLVIPMLIKNNPQMHAVCCRKVGNTLRDSVFAQLCWAIDALGLGAEFESKVSPLEITYKPTGQKIYFRGADDPIKLIERRNQMLEMRKSGKTYAEIGKQFGISRQRVFAILKGGGER